MRATVLSLSEAENYNRMSRNISLRVKRYSTQKNELAKPVFPFLF